MKRCRPLAVPLMLVVLSSASPVAQTPAGASVDASASRVPSLAPPGPLTRYLERLDPAWLVPAGTTDVAAQPAPARRPRSWQRKLLGGAFGGSAGFLLGGYLGAKIEGGCGGCDDPGLKGAVIGAPIGAVIGAIAGALWLF